MYANLRPARGTQRRRFIDLAEFFSIFVLFCFAHTPLAVATGKLLPLEKSVKAPRAVVVCQYHLSFPLLCCVVSVSERGQLRRKTPNMVDKSMAHNDCGPGSLSHLKMLRIGHFLLPRSRSPVAGYGLWPLISFAHTIHYSLS